MISCSYIDDVRDTHTIYYPFKGDSSKPAIQPEDADEIINIKIKDGQKNDSASLTDNINTPQKMVRDTWDKLPLRGYIGDFTTFAWPPIVVGDKIDLSLAYSTQESKIYYVKENEITLSTDSGFRQKITIDSNSQGNDYGN